MPSEVDAVNTALSHLGSDAQITSISPPDGSTEAGYGKRFLATARRELIELAQWRFVQKRATLTVLATNPSDRWLYAYQLPSDCIKPVRVLTDSISSGTTVFNAPPSYPNTYYGLRANDSEGAPFDVEQNTLFTNEPEAVLVYKFDLADFNKWTPMGFSAMCYLLAAYMAGPIVRGKAGASAAQNYRQLAYDMANNAMVSDANNGTENYNEDTPQSVAAR
jgi:hypothetical protein